MKKDKDGLKLPLLPPLGMPINPLGTNIADPFGSYTGIPNDATDMPVQDADDL